MLTKSRNLTLSERRPSDTLNRGIAYKGAHDWFVALKCLVFNWASHLKPLCSTAYAENMAGEGIA